MIKTRKSNPRPYPLCEPRPICTEFTTFALLFWSSMRYATLILFLPLTLAAFCQDPCSVSLNSTLPTCPGDANGTLTVVGTGGPYTYNWFHDAGLTGATATGLTAGAYTVIVQDTLGCISVLDAVVDEPVVQPLGNITTTDISCAGLTDGSVSFSLNPGPYTWQWTDAPNLTATDRTNLGVGDYTVTINGGPCPFSVTGTLGDPDIFIEGASTYCPSEPPQLTSVTEFGFSPHVYLWSTGETTTNIQIVPGTEGLIEVTAIDTISGCTAMGDLTLTELPYPTVAFAAPDTLCLRVSGVAITTSSTADSLVWRWGSSGFSNLSEPSISYTETDWQPISLQGFDIFGCGGPPVVDSVYVRPRLPANFTVEQVPCTPMVDLVFASTSDSCAFFIRDSLVIDLCRGYVRWDMRRYEEYDLTFYSTQPNLCDDTMSVHIDVRTEPTLFLPNAFTPDGDGINDTWPGEVDIPDTGYEVRLFDRWGASLWSTTDTQQKWDGSGLPIGAYAYTMRMRDPCEPTNEISKQGVITLVR